MGKLTAIIHSVAPVDEINICSFCDSLIDYVATGHFKLYAYILSLDTRRFRALQSLARDYYPVMTRTTELALLFSDRHTVSRGPVAKQLLSVELSVLGEILMQRFIVEDRLIGRLKSSTDVLPTGENFNYKRNNLWQPLIDYSLSGERSAAAS
jgi:regulator of sigma D